MKKNQKFLQRRHISPAFCKARTHQLEYTHSRNIVPRFSGITPSKAKEQSQVFDEKQFDYNLNESNGRSHLSESWYRLLVRCSFVPIRKNAKENTPWGLAHLGIRHQVGSSR